MDKHWHCVFDDSMRHTWIYFCYRFYASLVNSLTLSTPYVSCHSYFIGDLKVYSDSVFDDDLCISSGIVCLTIPCVTHESIFAIGLCVAREFFDAVDSIRQLSLILQWRFQGHQSLCFRWRFLVGSDVVFTDDSIRQRWLCFLYWLHPSTVN